jgi:hypothetical protein
MLPSQPLPTEDSAGGVVARRVLASLGPAYPAPDGSHRAAEMLAIGDALADVLADAETALAQAFADSATVMLDELERLHDLSVRPDMLVPDRQSRLLATIRASRGPSPQSIVASVRVIDPSVTVVENTSVVAAAAGVPAAVYVFGVLISAAVYADPGKLATIRALIAKLKPADTKGNLGTRAGFRCDDPLSLCDRDLLGE